MCLKVVEVRIPRQTNWIVSCWIAIALLFIGGFAFRSIQDGWNLQLESMRLPANTLNEIPYELDSWSGNDEPLSADVAEATDTQLQINRHYSKRGTDGVMLFVGYGGHVRDLAPHRPEVCFPSAGWTLQSQQKIEIPLADSTLQAHVFQFGKGGLDTEEASVLSTYLINGRFFADFADLRSMSNHSIDSKNYYARIQITSSHSLGREEAERLLREFARVIAPAIRDTIQRQADCS